MATNIEIKARARDFERQYRLAAEIAGEPAAVLAQEDVFFSVPKGRLKLRIFSPELGQLIAYERADRTGPKSSNYDIVETREPQSFEKALSRCLPVRGRVRKTRTLFLTGQTRIHLDEVVGLGQFLELEVVLNPGQSVKHGHRLASTLMERLEIEETDLVDRAYIDLICGEP